MKKEILFIMFILRLWLKKYNLYQFEKVPSSIVQLLYWKYYIVYFSLQYSR